MMGLNLLQRPVISMLLIGAAILSMQRPSFAEEKPSLDPALCRALVEHVPDANVAYQPGVDMQGNPVTPADLPGQPNVLPERIRIPLTASLAKTLNLKTYPYDTFGAGTELYLGELTIEGNRVLLEGRPLTDPQQEKLSVLCMEAR